MSIKSIMRMKVESFYAASFDKAVPGKKSELCWYFRMLLVRHMPDFICHVMEHLSNCKLKFVRAWKEENENIENSLCTYY